MLRRNQVLDKISSLEEEVGRLRERIPEDTNPQYDLWIRIWNSILQKIEDLPLPMYDLYSFLYQNAFLILFLL